MPGTETKVTPEIDVPIIATATTYHFEDLLALKNTSLVEPFRLVSHEISINTNRYIPIINSMNEECIKQFVNGYQQYLDSIRRYR